MAKGRSNISKACCRVNSFVRNLLLFPSEVTPITPDFCYVFEFDMLTSGDELINFTYENSGSQTVDIGSILHPGNPVSEIKNRIELGLNGVPISFETVTVDRTDIGGELFHYVIIIKNPQYEFTIIGLTGQDLPPTITDCT